MASASLAQLVEHALRKRMVVGSIPTGGLQLRLERSIVRAMVDLIAGQTLARVIAQNQKKKVFKASWCSFLLISACAQVRKQEDTDSQGSSLQGTGRFFVLPGGQEAAAG